MSLIKQLFLLSSTGALLRVAKMALAVSEKVLAISEKARIAAERQLERAIKTGDSE